MARKKKIPELEKILEKIPDDKQYIGRQIADELIFMQTTLKDLKAEIKENGVTEEFIQGKQHFTREAPALTAYNKTVARYSALFKQLNDLMPKEVQAQTSSAVYDFLKEG